MSSRFIYLFFTLFSIYTILSSPKKVFDYDLAVIGAGAAGLTAASIAAKLGKKVALIEKKKIGGGRIWSGDIPFKILFKKSELLNRVSSLNLSGLKEVVPLALDLKNILKNVRDIRENVYEVIKKDLLSSDKIDLFFSSPRFLDNHHLQLKKRVISCNKIMIATGARSKIPNIKGIDLVDNITREELFGLDDLPSSMVIVGGGPLGTEMACALSLLGIKITLIMSYGMLLPTYDYEVVNKLMEKLVKNGVALYCDMRAKKVYKENDLIVVECRNRVGKKHVFKGESLFLAAGGVPNIEGLDLEKSGVHYDEMGIKTNYRMQTNIRNIYACGDVCGLNILSRIAYYHAKTAVFNMFKAKNTNPVLSDYSHITKVVFTNPPMAAAGLSEQDARKIYGNKIKIYSCNYDMVEKAYVDHEPFGYAKFICDEKGVLIGAHVLGIGAGELIDGVEIGKVFHQMFYEHAKKIRTSPSYFDILIRLSDKCREEFEGKPFSLNGQPSIFAKLWGWLTGKKQNKDK